ncbi:FAD-binding domain-containing protein [Geodermatophilus ruber]|uniref:FAD binding domain of DNA photolyase n=1 Tax=Geodermatophilus ruber TaxID=504800 RepID=A0A1I4CXQ4_9ACTN|nr:FAD-binding domain-containing protein [Geodermatophilus ruber]SFK86098.1 FAD binding domain of DNA photolyase [Geodermatophilus ruber]
MPIALLWARRDLRVGDHPALLAARDAAGPDGVHVRRWVPELRDVPTRYVHEPWRAPDDVPAGCPEPIVDHAEERRIALDRCGRVRRA